jgi:hypothetical protein
MAKVDWENLDDVNRQIRIKELKKQVEKLGAIMSGESQTLSSEVQETFWQRVLAFEQAPRTTLFLQLIDFGVQLPDPKEMNEHELGRKLWEVIYRLAELKMYIESTDHLSDRELYTMLWSDLLHQSTVLLPDDSTCRRIDLIGSGSEEDTLLWLKYYADEESRSAWIKQFPDSEMPPHEDPPHSRDHRIPHP